MQPVYIDLHIHTYPNANDRTTTYDVATLVKRIKEYIGNEPFLISFTDHNTINKEAYLAAKALDIKMLLFIVVITFLFVDFYTIGTVIAVSLKADMVDKDGKVDGVGRMLMSDAVATAAGACLGASTTTTYVESTSGVAV